MSTLEHLLKTNQTPHTDPIICRIAGLCRKLGGELIRLDHKSDQVLTKIEGYESVSSCPFDVGLGLIHPRKTIYYKMEGFGPKIGSFIHEMGHIFACHRPPSKGGDEFEFLGWEICAARHLKVWDLWLASASDYCLGEPGDIGNLREEDPSLLRKIFRERVTSAKRDGLVSYRGVPQSIRS